jgi:hypothetical protein
MLSTAFPSPESEAPGGDCRTSYIGWRSGEGTGGLPQASQPLIKEEPVCLFGWRSSRRNGGRLECQACGLEFEADHDKGQAPA